MDFVVETAAGLMPIEVKATARPRVADTVGLAEFRREYGRSCRSGLLLHAGSQLDWFMPGVLAAPWWMVL